MKRLVKRLAIVALLALAPVSAALAQTACEVLAGQQVEAEARISQLLQKYPGTLGTLLFCGKAASEQPEADRFGVFMSCAGLSCLMIGLDVCVEVGQEIFALSVETERINQSKTQHACTF
jgi:hypothetical protein